MTVPGDPGVVSTNDVLARIVGTSFAQFAMWAHGVHLDFGAGCRITVESPMSITVGGEVWEGRPATGEAAAALLRALHADVTIAEVMADGTLHLATDAAVIEVCADSEYEAWQLTGPRNLLIVCLPGGGLAYFPGDDG